MSNFRDDERGATFIEFTAVFPLVLAFTFGLVDLGLLMFNWAEANRATYAGARYAAISDPVAKEINDGEIKPKTGGSVGSPCFVVNGINPGSDSGVCALSEPAKCWGTGPSSVQCIGGKYTPDLIAFGAIFDEIQKQYLSKSLDWRQVSVEYKPLPLGYVGRVGGPPMNVTVFLRCLKQEIYFLGGIFGWVLPDLPDECGDIADPNGFILREFSTTLPAEDLETNSFAMP